MIRAIVFDLFDTLVDLRWSKVPRMEHGGRELPAALSEMHRLLAAAVEVDFETFLREMEASRAGFRESHLQHDREVTTGELMRNLLARFEVSDEALADALTHLHMAGIRAGVETLDHHPELLSELGRSLPLALCSNFTHSETALAVLDQAKLRGLLRPEALVVSDAVGWRKPNARIFEATAKALGVTPADTLHVGDSLRADVSGAAALGARTVWITRRIDDPEKALAEHDGPAPDHVVEDLAELPKLIASLG